MANYLGSLLHRASSAAMVAQQEHVDPQPQTNIAILVFQLQRRGSQRKKGWLRAQHRVKQNNQDLLFDSDSVATSHHSVVEVVALVSACRLG